MNRTILNNADESRISIALTTKSKESLPHFRLERILCKENSLQIYFGVIISLVNSKNALIAGESHLSLCHTIWVTTRRLGISQGRENSSPRSSSVLTAIAGKKAIPMPAIAHRLIVSALLNSKFVILS